MATPVSSPYAEHHPSQILRRARSLAPYDHDELVHELAGILAVEEHTEVYACAGPYKRPAPVYYSGAHLPDVATASRSGKLDLFAVETPQTLFKPSTAETWRALAMRAGRHGRDAFWVVVRSPLREAVRARLAELKLQAWVLAL